MAEQQGLEQAAFVRGEQLKKQVSRNWSEYDCLGHLSHVNAPRLASYRCLIVSALKRNSKSYLSDTLQLTADELYFAIF